MGVGVGFRRVRRHMPWWRLASGPTQQLSRQERGDRQESRRVRSGIGRQAPDRKTVSTAPHDSPVQRRVAGPFRTVPTCPFTSLRTSAGGSRRRFVLGRVRCPASPPYEPIRSPTADAMMAGNRGRVDFMATSALCPCLRPLSADPCPWLPCGSGQRNQSCPGPPPWHCPTVRDVRCPTGDRGSPSDGDPRSGEGATTPTESAELRFPFPWRGLPWSRPRSTHDRGRTNQS